MSSIERYTTPPEQAQWSVPQSFDSVFRWEYEDGRDKLLSLYQKGKKLQWDAAERIDWSQELDPDNPAGIPDHLVSIYGSPTPSRRR